MTNIGATIYSTLKDIVDNKVYPLVAEESTTFPFIIYHTSASRPVNEKDRCFCNWEYTVIIDIVDNSYDNCVDICDRSLEALYGLDSDMEIEVESINELWQDNAYVRELTVRIKS